MATSYSPSIVRNGLVLNLDVANTRSYNNQENLFQYSQDLSNAYWFKSGVTITANSGIAPDGTNTANLVTTTSPTSAYFERTSAVADTRTYTYSAYVRGIGSSVGKTIVFGNYNNDLPRQNTSFILTQEWKRISVTFTPTQTANNNLYIHTIGQSSNLTTSDTFLIWGAQLELASSPSIYTATTNSIISRSTTWTDLSGNGNNSTLINGPRYNSLNNGSIIFVRASSQRVVTPSTTISYSGGTFEIWVKLNTINVDQGFMSHNQAFPFINFWMSSASNRMRWEVIKSATEGTSFEGTTVFITGIWYHVVGTFNATNTMTLYINGVQENQLTGLLATPSNVTAPIIIGDYGLGNFPSSSNISIARIYNRELSLSEVRRNYNATKGRYGL